MSTNYYIKCCCCKQEILHLGKVSNNTFISNLTKEQLTIRLLNITSFEYIENEYGNTFLKNDFLGKIPHKFILQEGTFC
jgi:hypothetical protein